MSGGYGSSHSGRPEATPEQVLEMYSKGLPGALRSTFGEAGYAANSLANAAAGANPIYTQSGLQQLNQYLPGYVGAGGAAAEQQATNTGNLISGAGGNAAIGAENLNRQINPEFYNTRATLADQTSKLFNSIGGPQLSPQELAATERAVNQGNAATGNSGQFNPYNTVANAMNFGQALRQKQALIGNTISQTTPLLGQVQNTNNTAGNFAVNAGNLGQNIGAGLFNPNQSAPTINAGTQFGSGVLQGAFGYGNSPIGESKNTTGGVNCCFIFMEAYYNAMPDTVRKCRDRYYKKYPTIANGYRHMAIWLVPLMKKFVLVRQIVWNTMIKPLTEHGDFVLRKGNKSHRFARKFWFTIWNFLGR